MRRLSGGMEVGVTPLSETVTEGRVMGVDNVLMKMYSILKVNTNSSSKQVSDEG